MADQSVSCPRCGASIPLTEAITHSIQEKLRLEYDQKLVREKVELEKAARARAADAQAVQFRDMQAQLAEKSRRLEESQQQELELRKKQRALEERDGKLDLEVERKVAEERQAILDKVREQFDEQHRLADGVKDKKISDMLEQIEALRRKGEQGSQKAQGDVQEEDVRTVLQESFRYDTIEPVPAGKRGADILHRVHTDTGREMGTILWEAKNTKSWSDTWLDKIKEDQRAEKVDLAVIVSEVLPRDIKRFGYRQGVWVTDFSCVRGVAAALREQLLALGLARQSEEGKSTKMELVYQYLAGPGFRQRVEAIIEAFNALQEDLDAERRAMEKIWAKREKQIERVLASTAGMYGDFQGIVGSSLPDVETLRLPDRIPWRLGEA